MLYKQYIRLILLMSLFFVGNANASNIFQVVDTDLSLMVFKNLFGELVGGGSDPMKNAIGFLNGAVLVIGGILLTYTIIAGTLGTAHDGEMLGKKFSSVWVPIRVSLGTAMVLPLNGGYSLIQHLVMWSVLQGIGLANGVWSAFISQPVNEGSGKISLVANKQIEQLAQTVFEAHLCTLSNKAAFDKISNDNATKILTLGVQNRFEYGYRLNGTSYEFGNQAPKAFIDNSTSCGSFTLPELTTNSTSVSNNQFGNTKDIFAIPSVKDIAKAHTTALAKMIIDIQPIAQKFVDEVSAEKTPTFKKSDLVPAQQEYSKLIQQMGNQFVANVKPYKGIQDTAAADGWVLAGAYYMKLSRLNSGVYSVVNQIPQGQASRYAGNFAGMKTITDEYYKSYDTIAAKTNEAQQATDTTAINTETANKSNTGFGMLDKAALKITEALTTLNLENLKNDTRHPIEIVADIGQRMFTAMMTLFAGLVALAATAGVLSLGSASGAIFTVALGFLPILGTLGVIYVFGNIFLPMLPFIIWLGAVIGFFILVVEAVIAAPLWAIMHLHPNGDDMAGKGGNGYMLLLGLLLRPMLMVFGLIASIILLTELGKLINYIFLDVLSYGQEGMGVGAIIFSTVIYVYVVYFTIMNIFKVIHQIPDELLKWLGGGKEQLGTYSQSMAKGTAAGYAAAAGIASSGMINATKSLGNGLNKLLPDGTKQDNQDTMKATLDNEMNTRYGSGASDLVDGSQGLDEKNLNSMSKNVSPNGFSAVSKNAIANSLLGKTLDGVKTMAGQNGVESFKLQFGEAKENGFSKYNGNQNEAIKSIGDDIIETSKAIETVKKADGDDGILEFDNKMGQAELSNYSAYNGSKAEAAKSISNEIVNDVADRKLSSFGNSAKNFANSMNGVIDKPTLANTLSRMANKVGTKNVDTILNDLNNSNTSPEQKKAQLQDTYSALKDVQSNATDENNQPKNSIVNLAESVAKDLNLNYSDDMKQSLEDTKNIIKEKFDV